MSADRETNHGMTSHDMTNTDIALLLADAADEVEIGIAPYQAVIRGGRRRRARRWAVAAATALALVGSAGTLAVAGLPSGDGGRGAQVATQPPAQPDRHVFAPERSTIATGTDRGKQWWVTIDVWGAPRNSEEAQAQWEAMATYGARPVGKASELIGKKAFFVSRTYGDQEPKITVLDVFTKDSIEWGTDIQTAAVPLESDHGPERLVIGRVARTAQQIKCTWSNGTSSVELPRAIAGSPVKWFVCVGPEGASSKTAQVIR